MLEELLVYICIGLGVVEVWENIFNANPQASRKIPVRGLGQVRGRFLVGQSSIVRNKYIFNVSMNTDTMGEHHRTLFIIDDNIEITLYNTDRVAD